MTDLQHLPISAHHTHCFFNLSAAEEDNSRNVHVKHTKLGIFTLTLVRFKHGLYSISVQESQPPGRNPTELPRRQHPFHVYPDVQGGYLVLKLAPTVVVYNPINDIAFTAGRQTYGPTCLIAGNFYYMKS